MYTHVHTIHTHAYTHIHTHRHTCTRTLIHTCMDTNTHTYMCIHTYMHRHIIHSYTHAYTHECVWLTHTHMNTHIHTHRFKAEGGSRGRHSNPSPHELKQEEHKFEVGSTWASNQETTSETKQTPFASPKPDRFWQSCFLSSFILSLDVISHF